MSGCDQESSSGWRQREHATTAELSKSIIDTALCNTAIVGRSTSSSISSTIRYSEDDNDDEKGIGIRRENYGGYDESTDAISSCSSSSSEETIATCLCVPYGDPWDDRATYRLRDLDLQSVRSSWKRLLQSTSGGGGTGTTTATTTYLPSPQKRPRHLHLESKGFGMVPGALAWMPAASLVKHLIQLKMNGNGDNSVISTEQQQHDELASLTHEESECDASVDFLTGLVTLCEGSLTSMSVKLSQEEHSEDERSEIEDALTSVLSHSDCIRHLISLSLEGFEGREAMELLLDQLIVQGRGCNLKTLDLKHFGANNISLLIPFLESYSGVTEVSIAETNLEEGRVFPNLAHTLSQQSSRLSRLALSAAYLTADSSLGYVAQIMESQKCLIALDLSGNTSLFESIEILVADDEDDDDFSVIDYRRKPHEMETFARALANHPSLQQLNIDNCCVGDESFACLMHALTKNHVLRKMWVDMRRLSIDSSWVRYMPSIRNLSCLYGFRVLTCQASWIPKVVPALRRNTCFLEIDEDSIDTCTVEISAGSPAAARVSNTTGTFFVDVQTKKILARNKYLARLKDQNSGATDKPQWPLWPRMLEKLASPKVDGSAFYFFLKTNSPNLVSSTTAAPVKRKASWQEHGNDCPDLLQRLRCIEAENKRLRNENDRLKHVKQKTNESRELGE